eukprot:GHVL01003048.1.p1 GENE.GHVL01003048.1~~GHVL01003048.1.p1  ORF type:complete len:535 (+),score=93.28 GHVL01003048.1:1730-3334(+)
MNEECILCNVKFLDKVDALTHLQECVPAYCETSGQSTEDVVEMLQAVYGEWLQEGEAEPSMQDTGESYQRASIDLDEIPTNIDDKSVTRKSTESIPNSNRQTSSDSINSPCTRRSVIRASTQSVNQDQSPRRIFSTSSSHIPQSFPSPIHESSPPAHTSMNHSSSSRHSHIHESSPAHTSMNHSSSSRHLPMHESSPAHTSMNHSSSSRHSPMHESSPVQSSFIPMPSSTPAHSSMHYSPSPRHSISSSHSHIHSSSPMQSSPTYNNMISPLNCSKEQNFSQNFSSSSSSMNEDDSFPILGMPKQVIRNNDINTRPQRSWTSDTISPSPRGSIIDRQDSINSHKSDIYNNIQKKDSINSHIYNNIQKNIELPIFPINITKNEAVLKDFRYADERCQANNTTNNLYLRYCSECGHAAPSDTFDEFHGERCAKKMVCCEYCQKAVQYFALSEHHSKCAGDVVCCKFCDTAIQRGEVERHEGSCRSTFCQFCQKKVNFNTLDQHKASCTRNVVICGLCNKAFQVHQGCPCRSRAMYT